jgi:hypothetical protein
MLSFVCALTCVLIAASTACDEVGVFHLELRVDLSVTDGSASGGSQLTFTFTNTGEETVEPDGDRFSFLVFDGRGVQMRQVYPDRVSDAPSRLPAGGSVFAQWDGRDDGGHLVAPGSYRVVVPYRAGAERHTRAESFTIG